jgi:hypothetical protein
MQSAKGNGNVLAGRDVYIQINTSNLKTNGLEDCPACNTQVSPEAISCPICGHPVKDSLRIKKLSTNIAMLSKVELVFVVSAAMLIWLSNVVAQSISVYFFLASIAFAAMGCLCKTLLGEIKTPCRSSRHYLVR